MQISSILKDPHFNPLTSEANEDKKSIGAPTGIFRQKSEFKAMQVKLLSMFSLAKSQLTSLYQAILSKIKKIDKHLETDDSIEPEFLEVLQTINERVEEKIEQMQKSICNCIVEVNYFDQLLLCLHHNVWIEQQQNSSVRKLMSYCDMSRKSTIKNSHILMNFDNLTQAEYDYVSKIKPKEKRVSCLGWLSGKWTSLQSAHLQSKAIGNMIPLSTMEANSLLELNLSFNFLTDLGFFKEAYFPSLLTLNLKHNLIAKLDGLEESNLPLLKVLNLSQNKIKYIDCLKQVGFPELKQLNLYQNKLQTIDSLAEAHFPALEVLNIDKNGLRNVDILGKCKFSKMKILSLCENEVGDLDFLGGDKFSNLESLMAYNNQIRSIKFLQKCKMPYLKQILLNNNLISDISVIEKVNFKRLIELDLENNRIQDDQFLCFVTKSSQTQRAKKKYPFVQL